MEVIIGTIFVGLLLLLVVLALQPGFKNLALAQQSQQLEAEKRKAIGEVGVVARQQIDDVIAQYGQLVNQTLADIETTPSNQLDIVQFLDNEFQ